MSDTQREGTGTRDWTPPVGEFRPSSLGACPVYSWFNIRTPDDEQTDQSIGRSVMMFSGHAAEHEYLRILNDPVPIWTVDEEVDNGFGGTCHPDALDYERRVVAEIKFTMFRQPAAYHIAQIRYYMHRMSVKTGETWTGEIHLLSKNGAQPGVFPVEANTAEDINAMLRAGETMMDESGPPLHQRMCKDRHQATNVKHYDREAKPPRKDANMVCPMLAKCFPPTDDMEIV